MVPSRPQLRPVEAVPIEQDGRRSFALSDPTGLAPDTLVVSPAVVFILKHFDGGHTLDEVRSALFTATGEWIEMEKLENVARALEQAHFLFGPAFEAHARRVAEEYRSAPFRPALHAGRAYPGEERALLEWHAALAPRRAAAPEGPLLGLAAPHIDPRFGGPSARLAHDALLRSSPAPETVVVLGTGHCAGDRLFTLTRQDFGTPLGAVATDRELVAALAQNLGEEELLGHEILHLHEHSVEFQALFLKLAWRQAPRPPMLLPVLVGSFHGFLESGIEPFEDGRVRRFAGALVDEAAALGRRVAYVASIDLAHQGPRYGDEDGLSPKRAARIEREDRELLAFAERGDAEGFFRHNERAKDWRRVCGFSALYMLLRLLPGARGRVVDYTQTTFPGTKDTVSHCAMLFAGAPS